MRPFGHPGAGWLPAGMLQLGGGGQDRQTDDGGWALVQRGSGQKVLLEPRQPPGPGRETIAAAASDPRR